MVTKIGSSSQDLVWPAWALNQTGKHNQKSSFGLISHSDIRERRMQI
jgi:hypothetical protein